jgi:hypothetical protein
VVHALRAVGEWIADDLDYPVEISAVEDGGVAGVVVARRVSPRPTTWRG